MGGSGRVRRLLDDARAFTKEKSTKSGAGAGGRPTLAQPSRPFTPREDVRGFYPTVSSLSRMKTPTGGLGITLTPLSAFEALQGTPPGSPCPKNMPCTPLAPCPPPHNPLGSPDEGGADNADPYWLQVSILPLQHAVAPQSHLLPCAYLIFSSYLQGLRDQCCAEGCGASKRGAYPPSSPQPPPLKCYCREVPSHVDVYGKEQADRLAKAAWPIWDASTRPMQQTLNNQVVSIPAMPRPHEPRRLSSSFALTLTISVRLDCVRFVISSQPTVLSLSPTATWVWSTLTLEQVGDAKESCWSDLDPNDVPTTREFSIDSNTGSP